jgi:hypothetical protein
MMGPIAQWRRPTTPAQKTAIRHRLVGFLSAGVSALSGNVSGRIVRSSSWLVLAGSLVPPPGSV